MPLECFVNEDLKKLVLAFSDHQHFLTVAEAETFQVALDRELKDAGHRVTLILHQVPYDVLTADAKKMQAQLPKGIEALIAVAGRPDTIITSREQIETLTKEKALLLEELNRLKQSVTAKPEPKTGPTFVKKDGAAPQ